MLFLQVILISLNAVFACAEIAVISMNDNKMVKLAVAGDKRALRLVRLTSQPARFLATIQVAITLSGFLGSAFAADNFSGKLVGWLVGLGVSIPIKTLDTIAVVLITIILSYFTLVFGELVPKRIAMRKAEPLALGMSAFIDFIAKIFAPVVWVLTASTNVILRLFGIDPNAENNDASEEEIRMMVDMSSEKGTIDREEKEFIQNVFEFDDLTAGEIATHRTEISLLWMDESMEQWEQTIHDSRHSLYPVCNETVDDVVGILNAKDYFRLHDKTRENVIELTVKPAYFVPESVKADVLFRNMKFSHNRLAVVLDEYGGISGIVTMNDLVEQLVGEFDDDADNLEDMPDIERIDSKTWKIHGSALLEDVSETLGISLPCDEFDTFGGLVFGALGVIPEDGSNFEIETVGLVIKVIEISDHLVKKAIVCLEEPKGQGN
ncbi:MAG: HlyC/CorC family transporter [Firmicutes bacterium HGW-Firmicutes-16]|nr:MAG: HlyC/CorC family transporter [Firmicutes bacterium HGW-Firmicutes-16]